MCGVVKPVLTHQFLSNWLSYTLNSPLRLANCISSMRSKNFDAITTCASLDKRQRDAFIN